MTMPDQVTVTQRAREAAADLLESGGSKGILCRFDHAITIRYTDQLDRDPFVQAFARFEQEILADNEAAIQKARADALGDAYDKLRGTNADLCKTPGAAYRLMLDTLHSLTENEQKVTHL